MNFLFVLSVVLLTNVLSIDPELQLCQDLTIDAAVVADDSIGYAIKGDFYWIIDVRKGINKNTTAGYLSDRWPGLTGPIDAAFTIDEARLRYGTVFLKVRNSSYFQIKTFENHY